MASLEVHLHGSVVWLQLLLVSNQLRLQLSALPRSQLALPLQLQLQVIHYNFNYFSHNYNYDYNVQQQQFISILQKVGIHIQKYYGF